VCFSFGQFPTQFIGVHVRNYCNLLIIFVMSSCPVCPLGVLSITVREYENDLGSSKQKGNPSTCTGLSPVTAKSCLRKISLSLLLCWQFPKRSNFLGLDRQRCQVHHRYVCVGYKSVIDKSQIRHISDDALETGGVSFYPIKPLNMLNLTHPSPHLGNGDRFLRPLQQFGQVASACIQ
jgi:hypothetical protein